MRYRLSGLLLAVLLYGDPAVAQPAPKPLLVLLQGSDLPSIREAVTAAGATITHDLPIISAVGASMTAAQLAMLREAPFIERVIDDLAFEPAPEVEEDESCAIAGALELEWHGSEASWRLFNKSSQALKLDALSGSWPEALGALTRASLGKSALTLPQVTGASSLSLPLEGQKLAADSATELTLSFERAPVLGSEAQNKMELKVLAGPDCEADMLPSYLFPRQDSYFPTVSGAARLHRFGVTGKGVTVAVLDSGLWEAPPYLTQNTRGEPRVIARYDAILGREVDEAVDESGHGTHMTSVIVDSRPVTREGSAGPSFRGVAPDAKVVAVKAFDRTGEAGFLDIVRGVQWVVDHREAYDIRVLNLSFASRPRWPYWDDPVNQALLRAWEAGIAVIAAAGNEGPAPMTVGSPGNLPYLITVGAITDSWTETDQRDDYLPDFSSRGPTPMGHIKPDVVAYGGHIAGSIPPGASLGEDFPEYRTADGNFVMTGTSQAAAVVSGLAALLIEAEPDVSNDDIKCMLMTSAEPAISEDGRLAYSPFLQGSGLVNVSRAITLGERGCGNSDLNLQADIQRQDAFQGPAVFPDDNSAPILPGQDQLITDRAPEKGLSESRRWGASAHIQRLSDPNAPSPIDWLGRLQAEQDRIRALASEND